MWPVSAVGKKYNVSFVCIMTTISPAYNVEFHNLSELGNNLRLHITTMRDPP